MAAWCRRFWSYSCYIRPAADNVFTRLQREQASQKHSISSYWLLASTRQISNDLYGWGQIRSRNKAATHEKHESHSSTPVWLQCQRQIYSHARKTISWRPLQLINKCSVHVTFCLRTMTVARLPNTPQAAAGFLPAKHTCSVFCSCCSSAGMDACCKRFDGDRLWQQQ